jgi:hypothetical protein
LARTSSDAVCSRVATMEARIVNAVVGSREIS